MNERRTKIALERMDKGDEIVFRVKSKRWLKSYTTELRVGEGELEATGDLGGYKRGTVRLPLQKVSELYYGPSGRGAVEGLYVCEGEWCSRCVLPWVSEQQADEVIAAIALRYPRLARIPASALEIAVGEAVEQQALVRYGWLSMFGRRGVAVAAPSVRA